MGIKNQNSYKLAWKGYMLEAKVQGRDERQDFENGAVTIQWSEELR